MDADGGLIDDTRMFSQLDVAYSVPEDCTTTGAIPVDSGNHAIDFNVDFVDPTTTLIDAIVRVLWVPFDGAGGTPDSHGTGSSWSAGDQLGRWIQHLLGFAWRWSLPHCRLPR